MSSRVGQSACLMLLWIFAAAVFLAGISWGLPSRAVDGLLFGEHRPWSGAEILALAPSPSDPSRAADVDANPIPDRDHAMVLNNSDAARAEIVRRYRLFSFQPDEMLTFTALSGMRPAKLELDPKLYQYGGLWIYPVGVLLKLASLIGIVQVENDRGYYLDHSGAFGRFYVVARLYTVAWGLLGVWAVFWLARRTSGSLIAASAASACFICMPVVVNMSHEAKPHLPGAVLMLCAIIAATKFVECGRTRWWISSAILCGGAAGMVLSAAVIIVILPLMVLLRRETWPRRCAIATLGLLIAASVYFAANPYVAINLVSHREILRSNFGNTAAMYQFGRLDDGLLVALKLVREGTSLGLAISGAIALIALAARGLKKGVSVPLILLAAPSLIVFLQLVALGAGKPGEFGRFALLPDIALAIAAASAVAIFADRIVERCAVALVLVALAATPGWFYLRGFIKDSSSVPTRYEDATWLRMLHYAGARTLAVHAEPAPYSLPPVDLFRWRLVLLPRGIDITRDSTDADVIVRAVDEIGSNGASAGPFVRQSMLGSSDAFPTRISWAGKPFEVWVRPDLLERLQAPAAATTPSR